MNGVLLLINGAVLLGCAVFNFGWLSVNSQSTLLTLLLLLLPFVDRQWSIPSLKINRAYWFPYAVIICSFVLVVIYKPDSFNLILPTVVLTALPEEWFFRGYFMSRLQQLLKTFIYYKFIANILTSLLFALVHVPNQGLFGLTIFLPSLFFGWLYQKTNDIVLVIFMHTLFNLIYLVFIQDMLKGML